MNFIHNLKAKDPQMIHLVVLKTALKSFAGMSDEAFNLSANYWHAKSFKKGELFNNYKNVCKELGFVIEGTFRSYIVDYKTGEDKNVFFFSQNGFVTAYKSFIKQIPCEYYTEALTDAQIVCINIFDLQKLYSQSHEWERFGRLTAEAAANIVIERTESFLLKSPEERYLELLENHPQLHHEVPLYHISSYLGIQGPSLSRIRKRIAHK
jgi:CRP-like cAMP-binding protein